MVLDGYDSGMRTGLRREEKKRHLKSVYVITQTYAPSPTSWVSHKHSSTARQMCENTHHKASHSEKQRSHNQPICFYGKMHSVLLMVILTSAMVVGVCEPVQPLADAAQRCFIGPVDSHTHVLLTSVTAYQLVNTSCSFSQAWHFCQSLFSSLTVLGNREDEMGTRQVLNQANMQSPVWMRISNGHPPTTTQTLSKQSLLKQEPQKQEDCRILDSWAQGVPQYSTSPCSHTLPFICKTSKDRYMKKKEMEESLTAHPSPFMQHLSQHGVTTNDVLGKPGADRSWSSVSNLLNISERYLRESREQLESRDFPSLVQILSQAAELPSADNRSHVTAHTLSRNFIGLADALISQENANKWHAIREVVSGPMAVVQTIDRMVTNLSPLLLEDADSAQFHFNNIRLQVQQKSVSESSAGSEFCSANLTNHSELDCISVPPQSIQELYNNGFQKVTVLSTWYNSLTPLMNTEENVTTFPVITDSSVKYMGTVLGSSVISSAVMGNGQLISLGVQYTLRHRSKNTSGMHYNPVCAFWDFSLMPEDGGGWSTEGCEIISSAQDSTSCYCNHTTNFALLLQIYDVQRSQENEKGLQILSFIGCGVSLCGLIFTFILFVAVGVPKSDRTTVHKNLIAALAIAQLLLIFSYWASANQELCLLVTALLHLFFLSSFCWMLVEGLLLWSKVVSVNISEDRRMRFYYALGWGLPVLIVAITLTVSLNKYKAEQHCWLNTESDIIWAFVGPVLFVLAVNTVVLCRVVVVTVSSARRRAKMLAPSSVSKPHTLDLTWAATRPVLILLPVLGLTWLCGILVHLSVVLAYLFIILNAFQGLYIFLVYAVYNSEVQNAIKRVQEKRKALSFTNCSQPISFLPSQKTPGASWVDSLQTSSSPESSSTSHVTNSTSSSLIFKNESFGNDSLVSFSFKPAAGNQVVQLMAFKPSGKPCLTFSCLGLTVM
uniref:Adhesion G protein-coupled receptor D2 n=1 Tax=Astyanax mexicanus TaxID=7994 RepID=A0A3B1KG58_ASTMX